MPQHSAPCRRHRPVLTVGRACLLMVALATASCRGAATPEAEPSPVASPPATAALESGPEAGPGAAAAAPAERAQLLLARGLAHAELQEWDQAQEAFRSLADLAPDEPVAEINEAVALYQQGDLEDASAMLGAVVMPPTAPAASRLTYYRGVIASHQGDPDRAFALYEAAFEAAPEEAAYAFVAAQEALKAAGVEPARRGELLAAAYELWGDNTAIATAYALWAVASADEDTRRRGLDVLEAVVQAVENDEAAAALAEGASDLGTAPPGRPPPGLQIVANLVQATPRFGRDQAALDTRLQVSPLDRLVSWRLRRRTAFVEPLISLSASEDLRMPDLAAGEGIVAALALEDAASLEESAPQDSGIVLVTDRRLVWRGNDASSPRGSDLPAGGVIGARAGDFDTDGRMELLLLTSSGIRIMERGAAGWSEVWPGRGLAESGALQDALAVDYDHDGDLDVIGLTTAGEAVVYLNRGDAGIDTPVPFPIDGGGRYARGAAFDVDGDADLDLVLAGDGGLVILANDRQGRFSRRDDVAMAGVPTRLVAADYRGDGHTGLIALTTAGLQFFRGTPDGTLEADDLADASTADTADFLAARDVATADLDLDGDLDVMVVGAAPAPGQAPLIGLENRGGGYFRLEAQLVAPEDTEWQGLLLADLDADKDPDVLAWPAVGAAAALVAQGAEGQGWFGLQLRAPRGKVPLDAKGAQVEVYAGRRYEKLLPEHPNLVVGVGSATPDLVRITWPNGISQYLFEPEVGGEYVVVTLELKVEGSCPFLYARDGTDMRFVTDVLGLAPLGLQVAPGIYAQPDEEEYVRLPDWVQPVDGAIELVITEELREVLYLDQAELVAVDAPDTVRTYNHERWYPGPVEGLGLKFLGPLEAPAGVTDYQGRDVLDILRAEDNTYLTNFPGKGRYQGTVATHSLIIELPRDRARQDHLGLLMIGWLHWSNTSNNIARGQDPGGQFLFPALEVPDGRGGWERVADDVGVPAGKTKPIVVDLGGLLNPADPRVRITTNMEVYWDRIAFGTILDSAAVDYTVGRLAPARADLAFRGFARWYRPAPNGPYQFDYRELRPYPWRVDAEGRDIPIAWDELAGNYTAFGPVGDLVAAKDDRLAVFGSGDHLTLGFDVTSLPPPAAGMGRVYFLHLEGWDKDGDFNVATSQAVGPIPYAAMKAYPDEGAGGLRPEWQAATLTRAVPADRLRARMDALFGAAGRR